MFTHVLLTALWTGSSSTACFRPDPLSPLVHVAWITWPRTSINSVRCFRGKSRWLSCWRNHSSCTSGGQYRGGVKEESVMRKLSSVLMWWCSWIEGSPQLENYRWDYSDLQKEAHKFHAVFLLALQNPLHSWEVHSWGYFRIRWSWWTKNLEERCLTQMVYMTYCRNRSDLLKRYGSLNKPSFKGFLERELQQSKKHPFAWIIVALVSIPQYLASFEVGEVLETAMFDCWWCDCTYASIIYT